MLGSSFCNYHALYHLANWCLVLSSYFPSVHSVGVLAASFLRLLSTLCHLHVFVVKIVTAIINSCRTSNSDLPKLVTYQNTKDLMICVNLLTICHSVLWLYHVRSYVFLSFLLLFLFIALTNIDHWVYKLIKQARSFLPYESRVKKFSVPLLIIIQASYFSVTLWCCWVGAVT